MLRQYLLSSSGLAGSLRVSCLVCGLRSSVDVPGAELFAISSPCVLERSNEYGARIQDSTFIAPRHGGGMAVSRYVV